MDWKQIDERHKASQLTPKELYLRKVEAAFRNLKAASNNVSILTLNLQAAEEDQKKAILRLEEVLAEGSYLEKENSNNGIHSDVS